MSETYNKNAREKELLEEAYDNVYTEGQFYGRDDLVKKNKEEDKARGAVKLELRDSAGTSRATLPKGDPKIDELLAKGYTKIEDNEDNESRAERADVDRYEYEQGKEAAYDSEAHAYRDRADKYKAEDAKDSIKVGNLYKGESYHELVIGIKGDEVYTDKGNRYDINQMLDELEYVDTIDFDFLNEIL